MLGLPTKLPIPSPGPLCQSVNNPQTQLSRHVENYPGYSGSAPTSFALNLPSDSAFTSLTGWNTVTVFQQAATKLWGLTSITNAATVHVRGLLSFDAGTYKLVASRIMAL